MDMLSKSQAYIGDSLMNLVKFYQEISILILVVRSQVKKGLVIHTRTLMMSILSLDLSELAII